MSLRDKIVGSCTVCGGSEITPQAESCICTVKFRAYNRMINHGFKENLLDLVSLPDFQLPEILEGRKYLEYAVEHPEIVHSRGLSLFIFSQDKGRGKTTLAHYLVYQMALHLLRTENYSRKWSFTFAHASDLFRKDRNEEDHKAFFLVIDDLGNEEKTSWSKGTNIPYLQRLFHYRRDANLPTFVTTNYKPSDLSIIYEGELDSLLELFDTGGGKFKQVEVGGDVDLRQESNAWDI